MFAMREFIHQRICHWSRKHAKKKTRSTMSQKVKPKTTLQYVTVSNSTTFTIVRKVIVLC